MNETSNIENYKEEFRLMIMEIMREFVKQPDAELQIDMRNGDTLYIYSKEHNAFDLNPAYLKIKSIVQRTHFNKNPTKRDYVDFEYVLTKKIQVIRLDDIVSLSYYNELEVEKDD